MSSPFFTPDTQGSPIDEPNTDSESLMINKYLEFRLKCSPSNHKAGNWIARWIDAPSGASLPKRLIERWANPDSYPYCEAADFFTATLSVKTSNSQRPSMPSVMAVPRVRSDRMFELVRSWPFQRWSMKPNAPPPASRSVNHDCRGLSFSSLLLLRIPWCTKAAANGTTKQVILHSLVPKGDGVSKSACARFRLQYILERLFWRS